MKTADFDFHLPEDRIALRPAEPRDSARLLVVRGGALGDHVIRDLPDFLQPGDALVFNDTRVIPARLSGVRERPNPVTGGAEGETLSVAVEATLHHRDAPDVWSAFMKPGKRLKAGDRVRFLLPSGKKVGGGAARMRGTPAADTTADQPDADHPLIRHAAHDTVSPDGRRLSATILSKADDGLITLRFDLGGPALDAAIRDVGVMPLPPYIAAKRPEDDRDRSDYQTVFAQHDGSVAAPTAGLHFTPALLEALAARGVSTHAVTLHVGAGTFLPVKADDTADHKMHSEWGEVSAETADALNAVHARGGRIVCIGTTSLRLLESATAEDGVVRPFHGDTAIFITPGYRFRAVDVLMTNFHLPKSTLFMLVSAFAGLETMRTAYAHAIEAGYRFYSYGDGSLLFRHEPDSRASLPIDAL
ncbi:S-adenosylmethionine:tRNA ribosyltransferase-isomerase [Brevundimonas sp. Leaf363]|uniref:tRNA preQ1(34) S-adenosylmethionine ribosyltransferase-isomerase QueA n=1 Tax=Brevundimonas sp. Leaf363 TaxID=1736353 RepID=UPI0006F99985|nr:tRNA preQ1(34) S-adenosylmethionine ribosyltransferase-isomerase QueA [Brevundimonas sp. Leaf363]KQS55743.1 S-adenosylmethionine:tRNA ribosyltransferase-isomerase [Brevundimonas sp. Leaf363]